MLVLAVQKVPLVHRTSLTVRGNLKSDEAEDKTMSLRGSNVGWPTSNLVWGDGSWHPVMASEPVAVGSCSFYAATVCLTMDNSGALWLLGWLVKKYGLFQMHMSIDTPLSSFSKDGWFLLVPQPEWSLTEDWKHWGSSRGCNDSYYTKHKTHHVQPTNQPIHYPAITYIHV
jgi:hypothetical protein